MSWKLARPGTSRPERLSGVWEAEFGSRLRTGALELAAGAHDASHYLLIPRGVVKARSVDDVAAAMRLAQSEGLGVTFRSGGTSLSGQAGGDGVVVDVRGGFQSIAVLAGGQAARCGPGVTVRALNAALAPYGRMIGPDPASAAAATIGGVVANNSSGMACGTEFNSYATLAGLTVTLPSGSTIDTTAADAAERLAALEPGLCAGLVRLRDRVRSNPESRRRIAAQYSMKNTMGYGVNSFVDFTEPIDILAHLMVGSEGTLGFISEVSLRTLAIEPRVATALMTFARLADASEAIEPLKQAGAKTLELMDAASIRAARAAAKGADPLGRAAGDAQTALLVELRAADRDGLDRGLAAVRRRLP
ncbi:MAG: FAD-binding oxidoreductase, partial [Bifidobacteriaceae bacterium]|nr:FAD-binding oxidoreductase [Bifidobacteriaceae bacterium]